MRAIHGDAVDACADLLGRCGASGFEIGYLHDDVPVEQAGWYAIAKFQGARITVEDHPSPTSAALTLAERLLHWAQCRCGRPVTLVDDQLESCRWTLRGKRWEPSCDVPSIRVDSPRGDLTAIHRAMVDQAGPGKKRRPK